MSAIEKGCEAIGGGCFWAEFWKSYEPLANFLAHDGLRNLVLIVVAIVTLFVAIKRLRIADEDKKTAIKQAVISDAGLNIDRFQKGVEMLGSAEHSIKKAGVVILGQFVKHNHLNFYDEVRDILCSFVTLNAWEHVGPHGSEARASLPEIRVESFAALSLLSEMNSWKKSEKQHDFIYFECRYAYLNNCKLARKDFSNFSLYKATLYNCYFEDSDFQNADLSGGDFRSSDFTRCDFQNAKLTLVDFDSSNFFTADFENADCEGTIFDHCKNLTYAQLSQAKNVDPEFLAKLKAEEAAAAAKSDDKNWPT